MSSHDPYAALRVRNYRFFLIGNLVANMGSQMLTVAVGWELYERTGSAMALGWVGLVQFVPVILFALPSGHLADRFARQRLLAAAQAVMALAALGLAVVSIGHFGVGWMYACLFATGVVRSVGMPAGQSLMPLLVPREVFSNAVSWRSNSFQIASTVGPAVGGFLIALTHRAAVVYVTEAVLAAIFIACLFTLRVPKTEAAPESAVTLASLLAGVKFVWGTKLILAAITLDMFAVLLGGATALLPVYAKDILHVGPIGLGWLRAMPANGSLVMGLGLAHRPPMRRAGRTLVSAVLGFGVATIVFGVSKWYWLSLAMLFAAGVCDSISVVVRHTLVQTRTPDALRGRVSAVNGLFISCSNEMGGFESGLVAACFGAVVSVVSGGVGTILVVLGVTGLWPELRKLRELHPPTAPETTEDEEAERHGV